MSDLKAAQVAAEQFGVIPQFGFIQEFRRDGQVLPLEFRWLQPNDETTNGGYHVAVYMADGQYFGHWWKGMNNATATVAEIAAEFARDIPYFADLTDQLNALAERIWLRMQCPMVEQIATLFEMELHRARLIRPVRRSDGLDLEFILDGQNGAVESKVTVLIIGERIFLVGGRQVPIFSGSDVTVDIIERQINVRIGYAINADEAARKNLVRQIAEQIWVRMLYNEV